jgi:hypothetical protein
MKPREKIGMIQKIPGREVATHFVHQKNVNARLTSRSEGATKMIVDRDDRTTRNACSVGRHL